MEKNCTKHLDLLLNQYACESPTAWCSTGFPAQSCTHVGRQHDRRWTPRRRQSGRSGQYRTATYATACSRTRPGTRTHHPSPPRPPPPPPTATIESGAAPSTHAALAANAESGADEARLGNIFGSAHGLGSATEGSVVETTSRRRNNRAGSAWCFWMRSTRRQTRCGMRCCCYTSQVPRKEGSV